MGEKCKGWAASILILGIAGSVISGGYMLFQSVNTGFNGQGVALGIAIIIGGCIISRVQYVVLTAIGEASENSKRILDYLKMENQTRLSGIQQQQLSNGHKAPPRETSKQQYPYNMYKRP